MKSIPLILLIFLHYQKCFSGRSLFCLRNLSSSGKMPPPKTGRGGKHFFKFKIFPCKFIIFSGNLTLTSYEFGEENCDWGQFGGFLFFFFFLSVSLFFLLSLFVFIFSFSFRFSFFFLFLSFFFLNLNFKSTQSPVPCLLPSVHLHKNPENSSNHL